MYKRDNPYRERGNKSELALEKILFENGKKFSRRGYPDYIVLDADGEIYGFVEVKRQHSIKLRKGQKVFARFCEKYGIPFAKWCPGDKIPWT